MKRSRRGSMSRHTRFGGRHGGLPCRQSEARWAPVTEYVAMPDGSSSAAPVIEPGPGFEKILRKRPCRTNARLEALARPARPIRTVKSSLTWYRSAEIGQSGPVDLCISHAGPRAFPCKTRARLPEKRADIAWTASPCVQ